MHPFRRLLAGLTLLLALIVLPAAHGAPGDLDPLDAAVVGSAVYASAVQPDGKTIIAGSFSSVLGQPRSNIARLNADGTLDAGFNPNADGWVYSVAVQADGRILLGGDFTRVGGIVRRNIARVDADGVVDAGFNPGVDRVVNCVAVQADGRILLGGQFSFVGLSRRTYIARVDAAGVVDVGFDPGADHFVNCVAEQADGRILVGGYFHQVGGAIRNRIARVDAAGLVDKGFNPDVASGNVTSVAVDADGRILLGGGFTTVGGTTRNLFARLVNDPATQTLSAPDATQVIWTRGGSSPEVSQVTLEKSTDGGANWTQLGSGTRIGSTPNWQLTGLALTDAGQLRARGRTSGGYGGGSSGLVEATAGFNFPPLIVTPSTAKLLTTATTLTITGTNFSPLPGQNTVAFTPAGTGIVTASTTTTLTVTSLSGHTPGALNAVVTTNGVSSGAPVPVATVVVPGPGDLDPLDAGVVGHSLLATAVQPDGKTIIAGSFTSVLGKPRNNIARLNADGTLDTGFNPNPDSQVNSVAVEADGRILLGGAFTRVGGATRNRIARVSALGALDVDFNPNVNASVHSVTLQGDGRILLGGAFTRVGGATRNYIARVDAAGLLDEGFNPNANGDVLSVAVQTDSRILLGGVFTTVGGTARNRIARVDGAGLLDLGFNPDLNGAVSSVAVEADGRILLGGGFTTVGGTARNRIARVDAAGLLDADFNPNANVWVYSVAVQSDGRILLGGDFTMVGGTARIRIARVNADGLLDAGFNPNTDGGVVLSVAEQADGRILLGGWFTTVGGTARNALARLVNDPAIQTLSAPDATHVTWTRGGSSPEVSQVTFEKRADSGAKWIPLGKGTRIGSTPSWQLSGLSLTGPGQLRARGRTHGGFFNGSSGLVEQVAAFTFPYTPFQQWKLTHLGDANAPDDGDPDFDGLPTILEYATGGDPDVAGPLPVASTVDGKLAITFPRNTAATDVTFTVQGSDDLSTWTDLARSTAGAPMVALDVGVNVVETGAGVLRTVEVRDLFLTADPAHPRRYLRLRELP